MSKHSFKLARYIKIVAVMHLPVAIVICLTGFVIKSEAPNIAPNTVFIYFIANYLSIGIKVVVMAGVLAIIISIQPTLG